MELHVWGLTDSDADRAHNDAKTKARAHLTRAEVEVIRHIGSPCPIRRREPKAIAQNATYSQAWALYESAGGFRGDQP